jgi:hypothetical protein
MYDYRPYSLQWQSLLDLAKEQQGQPFGGHAFAWISGTLKLNNVGAAFEADVFPQHLDNARIIFLRSIAPIWRPEGLKATGRRIQLKLEFPSGIAAWRVSDSTDKRERVLSTEDLIKHVKEALAGMLR